MKQMSPNIDDHIDLEGNPIYIDQLPRSELISIIVMSIFVFITAFMHVLFLYLLYVGVLVFHYWNYYSKYKINCIIYEYSLLLSKHPYQNRRQN